MAPGFAVQSLHREQAAPSAAWRHTVRTCREWLRWQDPKLPLTGMTLDVRDTIKVTGVGAVPSSRYDREGGPGEGGSGAYRPALIAAQLHYAALALPEMQRDAAFAARSEQRTGCITGMLTTKHKSEWLRHSYRHPLHPLKALLAITAVAMATVIEEGGWP